MSQCSNAAATAPRAGTRIFDTADRIIGAGYTYDALGRTLTAPLPAGAAALEYYANDMVRRQTIGNNRQTWWLDPGMRLRSWTTETKPAATWNQTAAKINHYAGDAGGADSPAWIVEAAGTVTRNITGITGEMHAATNAATANVFWLQLTTLHGDVGQAIRYTSATTSDARLTYDNDEYGNRKPGTTAAAFGRYAWLGAKQRSTETVGQSLYLMGVRLYNPASGRFLSTDPVPGGNANLYDYCAADPINCFDLDGRWPSLKSVIKVVSYAAVGVCVIGTAGACGVAAAVAFGASALYRGYGFYNSGGYRSRSGWSRFGAGLTGDFLAYRAPGVRAFSGYRGWHRYGGPRAAYQSHRSALRTVGGWGRVSAQAYSYSWTRWGF